MGTSQSKFEVLEGPAAVATPSGIDDSAQEFLEGIDLGIYAVPFQLAGINTPQQLQYLTESDLDRIQYTSHIPILPAHRQRILEASRSYTRPLIHTSAQATTAQFQDAGQTEVQLFQAITEADEGAADNDAASDSLQASNTSIGAQQQHSKQQQHVAALPQGTSQQYDDDEVVDTYTSGVSTANPCLTEQQPGKAASSYTMPAPSRCKAGLLQFLQNKPRKAWQTERIGAASASKEVEGIQDAATAAAAECKVQCAEPQQCDQEAAEAAAAEAESSNASAQETKLFQRLHPRRWTAKKAAAAVKAQTFAPDVMPPQAEAGNVGDQLQRETVQPQLDYQAAQHDADQKHHEQAPMSVLCTAGKTASTLQPVTILGCLQLKLRNEKPAACAGAGAFESATAVAPLQDSADDAAVDQQGVVADQDILQPATTADASVPAAMAAACSTSTVVTEQQQTLLKRLLPWKAKAGATEAAAYEETTACTAVTTAAACPDAVQQYQPLEAAVDLAPDCSQASLSAATVANGNNTAAEPTAISDMPTPAAAATGPPTPGPLRANKTALPKTARLPPIAQRRTAPQAWADLPHQVANQAYAFNAPLSVDPLPLPHTAAATLAAAAPVAVGAWAELPGEVSSLSYAATAPISKEALEPSVKPEAGVPAAAAPSLQIVHNSVQRHASEPGMQQQQGPAGPSRHSRSDSGWQQQQQSAANTMSAGLPPQRLHTNSSRPRHQAAAVASRSSLQLPPSVQPLHETVMARLRAQQQAGDSTRNSACASSAPPVPYNLKTPSEMLPSPQSYQQQRNTATASDQACYLATQPSSARVSEHGASHHHVRGTVQQQQPHEITLPGSTSAEVDALPVQAPNAAWGGCLTIDLSRVSVLSGASVSASLASERPLSSRPGSRAADVCDIVHRAKERVAARQRQQEPGSSQQQQQQQQQHKQTTPSRNDSSDHASSMAMVHSKFDPAAAGTTGSSGRVPDAVDRSSAALAVESRDGEYAMRMLQDYRSIAELDTAIKARVSQLAADNSRRSVDAAQTSAVQTGGLAGKHTTAAAYPSKTEAGQRSWHAPAAALPDTADTANRSDSGRTGKQQQPIASAATAPADNQALDGTVAVGLLGIREALNNSYDAGKPSKAGARASSAYSHNSSSSLGSRNRQHTTAQARDDAPYRNPFVSPCVSPSPGAWSAPATAAVPAGLAQLRQQQSGSWASQQDGVRVWSAPSAGACPALAVAGRGAAAHDSARDVDEKIKRIVLTSRARAGITAEQ